jgi:integrase/recombinase XerD
MCPATSFVREPRKIPVLLNPDEVARLIEAAPGPKYEAMFAAAYGAGLRVSEVAAMKVTDIDNQRMLIRIKQGKGRKDRYAMLSPRLLELLRDGYRRALPSALSASCRRTCATVRTRGVGNLPRC